MKTLLALLLVGIGTIQPLARSAELSTSELAQALGVDWWEVRLPGTSSDKLSVSLAVDFGDGRESLFAGGYSPFVGGTKIKVFRQPIDGEKMRLTIMSESSGVWSTSLTDVFTKGNRAYLAKTGSTSKAGEYLLKGSTTSMDGSPTLKKDDFALKVLVNIEPAPPKSHAR